jgi:3alpha(or 20beta)-hydroxysteroid dehydrogenase
MAEFHGSRTRALPSAARVASPARRAGGQGPARGIGAAAASASVSEGARVVVADTRDDEGAAVAAELGDRALYVHLDVRDEAAWGNAVQAARDRFASAPPSSCTTPG